MVTQRSTAQQLDLWDTPAYVPAEKPRIPASIHLGSVDWRWPQWGDLVWPATLSETDLEAHGLATYAQHPLFGTLCFPCDFDPIDRTLLRRYGAQLPNNFPVLLEAPGITTMPRQPRTGLHAAHHANTLFLDAPRFMRDCLQPALQAFRERLRFVILRFSGLRLAGIPPDAFAQRLGGFLERLPPTAPIAVELHEGQFLTDDYAAVLQAHGAAHVFTNAPQMPTFAEQTARLCHPSPLVVSLRHPPSPIHGSIAEQHFGLLRLLSTLKVDDSFILMADSAGAATPALIDAFHDLLLEDQLAASSPADTLV